MRRLGILLCGVALVASAAVGCTGDNGDGGQPSASTIGALQAPTNPRITSASRALEDRPAPPLAQATACRGFEEAQRFARFRLRRLASPPDAVCIEGYEAGQLPDRSSPEPWWVYVVYLPDGGSVDTQSFTEIVDGGGLILSISSTEAEPSDPPPTKKQAVDGAGETAPADVSGDRAVVQRLRPNRVVVNWWSNDSAGTRLHFVLSGDRTPDALVAEARNLHES